MADTRCYVTIVFKDGGRTSLWMERAILDQLTADFKAHDNFSSMRNVYPLLEVGNSPSAAVIAIDFVTVAYIA